jgi:hypothetical protein
MKNYLVALTIFGLSLGGASLTYAGNTKDHAYAKAGEDEQKVKLSEAPAAVVKTIKENAEGGKVDDELEIEEKDGKDIYVADVKINGKEYEIKVAQDGKFISKEAEEEKK